ncbi:MAG: hypothetical protein M0R33_07235 [Methylomonas sp.]|jgi:hypothetical protein|uniref:hypothetical protein n=1 Tax=Methylomonas sp. TaxID=418 RepID=UPI0025CEB547|nr:hypothetical protein [Methylomonas sp.]MCK9606231.1 hypothetical protein [Methylomonas sp.]
MSENNTNDMTAVAQAIGQLSGELRVMHQSLTAAIEVIRDDLRRIENSSHDRMDKMENNLNHRIDGIGVRVTALEAEDKRLIEKVAGLSALGGTIGGALAAAAVELIKRM